jgi:sec-independent protein translocase protein TatC
VSDFTSHLEELRRRLILCLVTLSLAAIAASFFSHFLLEFFTQPLSEVQGGTLFFQRPYEAFLIHVKVAIFTAIVVTSPLLITQTWLFVAPGLYQKEKKALGPIILISIVLFLLGAFFAYRIVVPLGLRFLLSFQTEELKPMLAIGPYFSFLTSMTFAFGILFDFPVVLSGLVMLGIVDRDTLVRARKLIVVFIFVGAAILTPSPDPVSQLLLAIPLFILFEISLVVAGMIEKRKKQNTYNLTK